MGEAARYDGCTRDELRARLDVPDLIIFDSVASTQDIAHALAGRGAPAGTLVLADAQSAGRGRLGRTWASPRGGGIWMTLLERPSDLAAIGVLAIRLGLAAASRLDEFAPTLVGLKWPNDLQVDGAKLAGILVESRWRNELPDWVVVGFGLNVTPPPDVSTAAGLRTGTQRIDVLERIVPALRTAAALPGRLSSDEIDAWTARDVARGRRAIQPAEGIVLGIDGDGSLVIEERGEVVRCRSGSLVLDGSS